LHRWRKSRLKKEKEWDEAHRECHFADDGCANVHLCLLLLNLLQFMHMFCPMYRFTILFNEGFNEYDYEDWFEVICGKASRAKWRSQFRPYISPMRMLHGE